ncbi:hypothetical protein EJB05_11350, partial [Eragrostis curvula]
MGTSETNHSGGATQGNEVDPRLYLIRAFGETYPVVNDSLETTTNQTKRPPHKPAPIQKTTESWRLAEYTSPTHTRWCDRSTASRPATAATCAGPIKLAGHIGYRCSSCNFDAHEACADYFKQAISFFAHPWHAISLSRIPRSRGGGLTLMTRAPSWACDVCREDCAPGRELRLLLRAVRLRRAPGLHDAAPGDPQHAPQGALPPHGSRLRDLQCVQGRASCLALPMRL